jgi:hypothetical protein
VNIEDCKDIGTEERKHGTRRVRWRRRRRNENKEALEEITV